MSMWTITLLVAYFIVVFFNLVFNFSWLTGLYLLITLAIIMLPAGLLLIIGKLLPEKYFNENRREFKIGRFKEWVCNLTSVKSWKDSIPVGNKVLDSMSNPKDEDFLNEYIIQSCFAEWLHTWICYWSIVGSIIVLLINKSLFLPMALPIAIIFIYQNITSTIIQWFVRPRMIRYRELLLKRKQRQKEDNLD